MSWDTVKAIAFLIAFMLLIIFIGNWGWPIILGTISLGIICVAYVFIRIILEYPGEDSSN